MDHGSSGLSTTRFTSHSSLMHRKRKHDISSGREEKPSPEPKTGCYVRMTYKCRLMAQAKKLLDNPECGKFPVILQMKPDQLMLSTRCSDFMH